MNNLPTHPTQPGAEPGFADRMRHSKALIPTIAVLGVTVLALAAALVVNRTGAQTDDRVAAEQAQIEATQLASKDGSAAPLPPVTAKRSPPTNYAQANPDRPVNRPVVCGNCGTVESVTPVQRTAPTSGVGAVAGGVVGGLLGNQVGGGNGRTAMTVLGAVGGGFAGNAIEKKTKTVTTYQMRVRMNDGSIRTVEQSSAVSAGSQVQVDGNTLRAAPAPISYAPQVHNALS